MTCGCCNTTILSIQYRWLSAHLNNLVIIGYLVTPFPGLWQYTL
jgi:hypothetical protein